MATGPLTSDALAEEIEALSGERLYFYERPRHHPPRIVGRAVIYLASRYGKGEAAYLNCPMTEEEYYAFVEDVAAAELSPIKDFEEDLYFEGCLPVETIARRGKETLRFGPMKPVGLPEPSTGKNPLRRRAAAPGRRRGPPLQYRRLPDAPEVGRAAARLPYHPGTRQRRLRPHGRHAPQHLPALQPHARGDHAHQGRPQHGTRSSSPAS